MKKNLIHLTDSDRAYLKKFTTTGQHSSRELLRAMILLRSDAGDTPTTIIQNLQLSRKCVWSIRKKYCEEGLQCALHSRPQPHRPKRVTPTIEAYVTALACEAPPAGHSHMTISLIQQTLDTRYGIRLGWGTVKKFLHTHHLKPWKKKCGVSHTSIRNSKPA